MFRLRTPEHRMVTNYLARYASGESALAAQLPAEYDSVLVVPACDEAPSLLEGLAPAFQADRSLLILIVNGPPQRPDIAQHNREVIDLVRASAHRVDTIGSTPPAWLCSHTTHDILLIDRASSGQEIPKQHGVGGARRIGCDIALALGAAGRLATRWIRMSDGDVTLPADYFQAGRDADHDVVGLAYKYEHYPGVDQELDEAHVLYELSLRYYVLGLRWAGSCWDFETIGSTMAFSMAPYAAVRGIPRRAAAEDFYFFAKLAKLGRIITPKTNAIRIAQRTSKRVPFGTGAGTGRIVENMHEQRGFTMYHPDSFRTLRALHVGVEHALECRDPDQLLAHAMQSGPPQRPLIEAIQALKIVQVLSDCIQRTDKPDVLRRRWTDWFDAFRTLKFIHATRDAGLAKQPWRQVVEDATFTTSPGQRSARQWLHRLRELEFPAAPTP